MGHGERAKVNGKEGERDGPWGEGKSEWKRGGERKRERRDMERVKVSRKDYVL